MHPDFNKYVYFVNMCHFLLPIDVVTSYFVNMCKSKHDMESEGVVRNESIHLLYQLATIL